MDKVKFNIYCNLFSDAECEDMPDWKFKDGKSCKDYENLGFCKQGFAKKYGNSHEYPEHKCCACGKLGRGNHASQNIIF